MDGAEGEGGENAHRHVNGICRGTVETGAAVTVQSLSKGDCTARVTRLGLAESSSDQGRPGLIDEPPLLYSSVMKGCTSATFNFEY